MDEITIRKIGAAVALVGTLEVRALRTLADEESRPGRQIEKAKAATLLLGCLRRYIEQKGALGKDEKEWELYPTWCEGMRRLEALERSRRRKQVLAEQAGLKVCHEKSRADRSEALKDIVRDIAAGSDGEDAAAVLHCVEQVGVLTKSAYIESLKKEV